MKSNQQFDAGLCYSVIIRMRLRRIKCVYSRCFDFGFMYAVIINIWYSEVSESKLPGCTSRIAYKMQNLDVSSNSTYSLLHTN